MTLERLWRTGEILLRKPRGRRRTAQPDVLFPGGFPPCDSRTRPPTDPGLGETPDLTPPSSAMAVPCRACASGRGSAATATDTRSSPRAPRAKRSPNCAPVACTCSAGSSGRLASRLCLSHNVQSPPASFSTRLSRLMEEAGERGQADPARGTRGTVETIRAPAAAQAAVGQRGSHAAHLRAGGGVDRRSGAAARLAGGGRRTPDRRARRAAGAPGRGRLRFSSRHVGHSPELPLPRQGARAVDDARR